MKTEIQKKFEEVGLGYIPECEAMPAYLMVVALASSGNQVSVLHWSLPDHYHLPDDDVGKLKELWRKIKDGGARDFNRAFAELMLEGTVNEHGIRRHYRELLDKDRTDTSRQYYLKYRWVLPPHGKPGQSAEVFYARIHGLVFRVGLRYREDTHLLEVGMRVHENWLTRTLLNALRTWVPRSLRYEPVHNERSVGDHHDLTILFEQEMPELADQLFEQLVPLTYGSTDSRYVWSLKEDFAAPTEDGWKVYPAVRLVLERLRHRGIPVEAFHYVEDMVS